MDVFVHFIQTLLYRYHIVKLSTVTQIQEYTLNYAPDRTFPTASI